MRDVSLTWRGAEYAARVAAAKDVGVEKAALVVQKDAMEKAPVDTGTLRNSITYRLTGGGTAQVGSNLDYAASMEFGGSRQAPRGYLGPALTQNRQAIKDLIADEVRKVVR